MLTPIETRTLSTTPQKLDVLGWHAGVVGALNDQQVGLDLVCAM